MGIGVQAGPGGVDGERQGAGRAVALTDTGEQFGDIEETRRCGQQSGRAVSQSRGGGREQGGGRERGGKQEAVGMQDGQGHWESSRVR